MLNKKQPSLLKDSSPYRSLWASVVLNAIRDMDDRSKDIRAEATRWLYERKHTPQSFLWICLVLDIDPNPILQTCMTRRGRKAIMRVYKLQIGTTKDFSKGEKTKEDGGEKAKE